MNRKPRTFVTAAVLALAFVLSAVPAVHASPLEAHSLAFDLGGWWDDVLARLDVLFSGRIDDASGEPTQSATTKEDAEGPASSCFIDPNGNTVCRDY